MEQQGKRLFGRSHNYNWSNGSPCMGCKERSVDPPCHDFCEKYKKAKEVNGKMKNKRDDYLRSIRPIYK